METAVAVTDPARLAALLLLNDDGIVGKPEMSEVSGDVSAKVLAIVKFFPAYIAFSRSRADVDRQVVPMAVPVPTLATPIITPSARHGGETCLGCVVSRVVAECSVPGLDPWAMLLRSADHLTNILRSLFLGLHF